MKSLLSSLVFLGLLAAGPLRAQTDADNDVLGPRVLASHGSALVGIEVTLTGKLDSTTRELSAEGVGTALSSEGLVVTSLSGLDHLRLAPDTRAEAVMQVTASARSGNLRVASRLESANLLKNARLRRADGTWVPAKIVLRDEELDLLFLAPAQPDPAYRFPCLDLAATAPYQHLGKFFGVSREGSDLGWAPNIQPVSAGLAVHTPRPYFLNSNVPAGCPVIDANGRWLGLSVHRLIEGKPRMSSRAVLSATELLEPARQATQLAANPA